MTKSMGSCSSSITPEGTADVKASKSGGKGCKCCHRESGTDHTDRPCKEEAKSWSNSFDKLMESPIGRKLFQEFLQTQYSDENLKFWMAADAYQTKTAEERKDTARQVYEDFISTISPCEVSIDAKLRSHIEDNLDSGDPDLFVNAKNYIYNLMSLDCFPRLPLDILPVFTSSSSEGKINGASKKNKDICPFSYSPGSSVFENSEPLFRKLPLVKSVEPPRKQTCMPLELQPW